MKCLLAIVAFGISVYACAAEYEDLRFNAGGEIAPARFGSGVAVDDSWVIVGDRGTGTTPGTVYAYEKDGSTYLNPQVLSASDGSGRNHFGLHMALEGSTLTVSADKDSENGEDSGSVYVFELISGIWTETQKIVPADGAPDDWFGCSVALSGDFLAIGAYEQDLPFASGGAVYVYTYDAVENEWALDDKLMAADGGDGISFGASVALHGNTLVAGAPGWNFAEERNGAAYVFVREAGSWVEQEVLLPSPSLNVAEAAFGLGVAVHGERAVVGAWNRNGGIATEATKQGAAYVYRRTEGVWAQETRLRPQDPVVPNEAPLKEGELGLYVALTDEFLLMSRHRYEAGGIRTGSAYAFANVSGVWTEVAMLLASDGDEDDELSYAIAVHGSKALLGEPARDGAYLYDLEPLLGTPEDVNGDGGVNAIDVQLVINGALGVGASDGDVNKDGAVNALDVQLVINAALGV